MLQEKNLERFLDLKALAVLVLLGILLPAIPIFQNPTPTLYPKLVLWGVINIAGLTILKNRDLPLKLNALIAAFVGFALLQLLGLLRSDNFGEALLNIGITVQTIISSTVIATLLLSELINLKHLSILLCSVLVILLVWASAQWMLSLDGLTLTHQASYMVKASLGHRNLLAHFIMLLTPVLLPLISNNHKTRVWFLAILIWSIVLCIAMLSRGAWILTIPLFAAALWILNSNQSISKTTIIATIAITMVVIGVFLAFILDDFYTIQHQFITALNIEEGNTRDRLLLAYRSILLFLEAPLFGIGLGDWPIEIMKFDQTGMATASGIIQYQNAHNDFAQKFAESGLLGGLSYLLVLSAGMIMSLLRLKRNFSEVNVMIGLTWAFYFWISLTNYPMERMEFLIVLAILMAITPSTVIKLNQRYHYLNAGILVSVGIVVVFSFRLRDEFLFQQAIKDRDDSKWADYFDKMSRISSLLAFDDSSRPISWHMGLAKAELGEGAQAKAYFEQARSSHPFHSDIHFWLGKLAWNNGQLSDASDHIENAVRYSPSHQRARVLQSAIFDREGKRKKAFNIWLQADHNDLSDSYKSLGTKLSIDSLNLMVDNFPERRLMLSVLAFRNTPQWAFEIIHKTSKNNLSFPTQVLIEACYYMFEHCEGAECEEVARIKLKYIPEHQLNLPSKTNK